MSVWKKLNTQDAFVTSYVAKKQWNASPSDLEGLGVRFLPADNTYVETDCKLKFKTYSCTLDVEIFSCTLDIIATVVENDCSLSGITAELLTGCDLSGITAELSNTSLNCDLTDIEAYNVLAATSTPTPTPTLDCNLTNIEAYNVLVETATPTPTNTFTPTPTSTFTPTPTATLDCDLSDIRFDQYL